MRHYLICLNALTTYNHYTKTTLVPISNRNEGTHMTIHYQIKPIQPETHLFSVEMTVTDPDPTGQQFMLPAWIPGSYLIRDFAKHIVTLQAFCNDKPIHCQKIDKQIWQCEPCQQAITLKYEVYAWDLSVRGAHLDDSHGFYNGSSVFLLPLGKEQARCEINIVKPEGDKYKTWKVITALRELDAARYGFGHYFADNYDELIDHPVEIGTFTLASFTACGVQHDIAITGQHQADMNRLCQDLTLLCEQQIRFFGEPAPFNRYVFLVTALSKDAHGGLEHRASTSLHCPRDNLPQAQTAQMTLAYADFLSLCSHEYFHTWHVKRSKPAAFFPYDLSQENYTQQLWIFEGFTSYYQDLFLKRTRLIDENMFLNYLSETFTRVWRHPGRFIQSVAQASFDAWIKLYQPDENAPNSQISYYSKGAVVALALDMTIREITAHRASLDDVVRLIWQRYGKMKIGMPEGAVEQLVAEVIGYPLDNFFADYVYGTKEVAMAELLEKVGVNFALRPRVSQQDKGGAHPSITSSRSSLGINGVWEAEGLRVINVYSNSAAAKAGISAGDLLVVLNKLRFPTDWENVIANLSIGQQLLIYGFRRDEWKEFSVILQQAPADTVVLTINASSNENIITQRQHWYAVV